MSVYFYQQSATNHIFGIKKGAKITYSEKVLANPIIAFPLDIKQKHLYTQRKLSKYRVFPLIIEQIMRFSVMSELAF